MKVWESKIGKENNTQICGQIMNVGKEGIAVATLDGEILLTVVQPEGKKKMNVQDFLNGHPNKEDLIGKIMG